jgi:hypothetical protein
MKLELLRLLSAQASQYKISDHVWESLKPADISHILGLMAVRGDGERLHHNSHTQAAVWLGEAMYLDNRNNLLFLADHVGRFLVRRLKLTKNLPRIWTLTRYAINSFVDPKLCPECHGAGRIPMAGVIGYAVCDSCGESGLAGSPSGNKIANDLGIESSRWVRTWGDVYEEADWKIRRLHDSLVAVFAARLGHAQENSGGAQNDQYWPYGETPKNQGIDNGR